MNGRLLLTLATAFFCSGALGQQSRQEKVEDLLKLAYSAPTQQEGAQAVDRYLNSLPESDRIQLEADTWNHLRKTGAISRTVYIQSMLEMNERLAPNDYVALDYWRYQRMIDAKVNNGTLPEEDFRYLSDKKLDESRVAQERKASEPEPINQAQQVQQQYDPTGLVLQSIGQSLRSRANSLRPLGSPLNCTTRNIGGTIYTDCR